MGGFLSFVNKEILHILRDTRTMLIALLMPVILTLLFGFAMSVELNNIDFAVVANNRTEAVRQQVERLAVNPYFSFKGFISEKEITPMLRSGEADAVAFFANDYDRQLQAVAQGAPAEAAVKLIFDASNPNNAASGAGYMQGVLMADLNAANAMPETRILYNPQMKSSYNFVPGILGLIFILICAMLTSVSIVREKETGTMEILLVSPVRPIWIIFAKMIPYFLLSCINLASILLLAKFALDVPMSGSMPALLGISLLYLILALSLGLLISTVATHQSTALLMSAMMLMMPIMMLSGMMFPIENMPEILQVFSNIVPARWYIDAMRKIMIEGLDFADVFNDFIIILGMTVFILAVALKKFNDKLE